MREWTSASIRTNYNIIINIIIMASIRETLWPLAGTGPRSPDQVAGPSHREQKPDSTRGTLRRLQ